MCGIFGYSGKYVDSHKLKILALYNDSRGGHATGVYSDKRGIIKNTYSADRFISIYNDKFLAHHLFLGHTKYKTHGSNTVQNAHPYQYGRTIGIHNGVLGNYDEIAAKYNASIDVDSQCIFLAIENNIGSEEYILPEITGAMAIAYTKSDGLLYLYRRDNPIFIGYCDGNLYFSSLDESLEAINCNDIQELIEHNIYSFKKGLMVDVVQVEKPEEGYLANWYDYDSGFDLAFSKEELADCGVSVEEIGILCKMSYEEQEQYLLDNGYLV